MLPTIAITRASHAQQMILQNALAVICKATTASYSMANVLLGVQVLAITWQTINATNAIRAVRYVQMELWTAQNALMAIFFKAAPVFPNVLPTYTFQSQNTVCVVLAPTRVQPAVAM